jgi:hypothetical protein
MAALSLVFVRVSLHGADGDKAPTLSLQVRS